jgi:hypothetical protein
MSVGDEAASAAVSIDSAMAWVNKQRIEVRRCAEIMKTAKDVSTFAAWVRKRHERIRLLSSSLRELQAQYNEFTIPDPIRSPEIFAAYTAHADGLVVLASATVRAHLADLRQAEGPPSESMFKPVEEIDEWASRYNKAKLHPELIARDTFSPRACIQRIYGEEDVPYAIEKRLFEIIGAEISTLSVKDRAPDQVAVALLNGIFTVLTPAVKPSRLELVVLAIATEITAEDFPISDEIALSRIRREKRGHERPAFEEENEKKSEAEESSLALRVAEARREILRGREGKWAKKPGLVKAEVDWLTSSDNAALIVPTNAGLPKAKR